jgi:hypothetical protein
LDEVAIYNHALGKEEIQGIYNAGGLGKTQESPELKQLRSIVAGNTVASATPGLLDLLVRARGSLIRTNSEAAINQLWAFQRLVENQLVPVDPNIGDLLWQSAADMVEVVDPTGSVRTDLQAPRTLDCQSVTRQPNGRVRVKVVGDPGQLCEVECSDDLENWQRCGPAAELGPGCFVFDDKDAMRHTFRFYRVVTSSW